MFGDGSSMSFLIFIKMKANDHHSGDSIKAIGRKEVRQMGRDLRQFVRRYTTAIVEKTRRVRVNVQSETMMVESKTRGLEG